MFLLGEIRKEIDDHAGEPIALVFRIRAAPVILYRKGQGRPQVQRERDSALEVFLGNLCDALISYVNNPERRKRSLTCIKAT
jgi:hypothetical protein